MAMLLSTPPATDEQAQDSTALSTLNNAGLLDFTIRRTEKSLGSDEFFSEEAVQCNRTKLHRVC